MLKNLSSNWKTELCKLNQILKNQPPIYRIEDIDGEIIEDKC